MTAYIYTPESHQQVIDALSIRDVRLHESALAMLKAMKPVEPCAFVLTTTNYGSDAEQWDTIEYRTDSWDADCSPLYAKEQQ